MGLIKDLQNSLFKEVSLRVVKYGFDRKRKVSYSFYKLIPLGRQYFQLCFIRHKADVDVTLDVSVRFDALEDMLDDKVFRTEAEKKDTASFGVDLGNLIEGEQKRFTLASVAEVGDVADEVVDYFVRNGIPYLEKYSNMEAALELLSGDDLKASIHSPFHDYRARRAIGLAYLLGNKDRFYEIAAAKTEFLTSRDEQGLDTFLKLRDDLAKKLAG